MTVFSAIGISFVILLAALGCCPSLFSLRFLLYARKQRQPHHADYFRSAIVLHLIALSFLASLVVLFVVAPEPGGIGSMALPLYVICAAACWWLHGLAKSREDLAFQKRRLNA